MSSVDPEVRRQRIATGVKWGVGLAGAVLISPIVFLAVKGLVGLALAAAIGFIIINFAPVFAMKIANWKMKAIVAEAEANPIETMKNLKIEKANELDQADTDIVEFETEIGNFDDEVRSFKRDYPEDAPSYESISEKMHDGLAALKMEQEAAREKLADLDARIAKAEAIYKMSLAAQRVTALSKSAESKVFAEIKEKVAFDAVRTELNRSFASLNLALRQRATLQKPALPARHSSGPVVDVTPKEKVQR